MQAEVNVALSDDDVSRIADAVIVKLKELGVSVTTKPKDDAAAKPTAKPAAKPKAADKPAEAAKEPEKPAGPSREDVIGLLQKAAEKFGGDRSKAIEAVNKYAAKFGDVKPEQFADLAADLQALIDAPAEEAPESGDGW